MLRVVQLKTFQQKCIKFGEMTNYLTTKMCAHRRFAWCVLRKPCCPLSEFMYCNAKADLNHSLIGKSLQSRRFDSVADSRLSHNSSAAQHLVKPNGNCNFNLLVTCFQQTPYDKTEIKCISIMISCKWKNYGEKQIDIGLNFINYKLRKWNSEC